ncbi:bacteriorhodopsin [Halorubraceae archaeon YAN]|nr:bacteriorhodopsin [Halorubraceae archaeon YAN]
MIAISTWAWIGTVGLAIATIPPLWFAVKNPRNRTYYAILAAITGIAAASYAAMALNIGTFDAPGDAIFYAPRYIDWLLTTPLLVLYLAMLCKAGVRMYATLITLDIILILSGAAAVLTTGTLSWALFGVGSLAYLGLAYLLVKTVPQQTSFRSDRISMQFFKLRNITVVLWTLYPVVWVFSPAGFGWLTLNTEMMVVVYLDFITKVAFVAIAVNGRAALDDLNEIELTMNSDGVESALGAD